MGLTALVSQHEDHARDDDSPFEHHLTPVPTQALARLDRFATASLLAAGLAHEIANPLSTLMAALDWTNERVERLRKHAAADAAQLDKLATDVELALVSARSITALVRDFQLFLRPDEVTPIIGAAEVKPAVERALQMARARLGAVTPVSTDFGDAPEVRVPVDAHHPDRPQPAAQRGGRAGGPRLERQPHRGGVRTADGRAVIEVRDNGPGMTPETRRHLFEPGHTGQADGGTSLGMGLAISPSARAPVGRRHHRHLPARGRDGVPRRATPAN